MARIEVDSRVAVALDAQARRIGLSVAEYLKLLVPPERVEGDSILTDWEDSALSLEESERQLEELLFSGPTLPPDFSRADIYDPRDSIL